MKRIEVPIAERKLLFARVFNSIDNFKKPLDADIASQMRKVVITAYKIERELYTSNKRILNFAKEAISMVVFMKIQDLKLDDIKDDWWSSDFSELFKILFEGVAAMETYATFTRLLYVASALHVESFWEYENNRNLLTADELSNLDIHDKFDPENPYPES